MAADQSVSVDDHLRRAESGGLHAAPSPKQYAEHREELREELFEQRSAAWTDRLRAQGKIQIYRKDLKLE